MDKLTLNQCLIAWASIASDCILKDRPSPTDKKGLLIRAKTVAPQISDQDLLHTYGLIDWSVLNIVKGNNGS